jgi:AraC family transcriptional regulator
MNHYSPVDLTSDNHGALSTTLSQFSISTSTDDHPPKRLPTASAKGSYGLMVSHLIELASNAVIGDPRSAKAYLQEATALLDCLHDEPLVGESATTRVVTLAKWQMRRINDFIDLNIEGPIRNRDLAMVARLSVSYLSRTFKLTTGRSLHDYVLHQRVRRAKLLMTQSSDRLSQIAVACGFADQAHLSRMFKHKVGESPAPWRRSRERVN